MTDHPSSARATARATPARAKAGYPRHAPRAPRTPFVLLVLGLIVGGMCALLALNTASAANELTRHDLAAQNESIAAQLADLENQVAASAAPANLAAAAARLGMVVAGNPAFLVVGKDGKVHLLGSPAAATGYPVYVAPRATKSATTPNKTPPKPATAKTATAKTATPKTASPKTASPKTAPATSTESASETTPKTSPTPTPTPNTTLPGGTR